MTALRGPILIPRPGGTVDLIADGLLCWAEGLLTYVGPNDGRPSEPSRGLILPPLLDCHIHIPQWPIRGHFCDGVGDDCTSGRLLEGLNRNVFPIEAKCAAQDHAAAVVEQFRADTLSHGVVGGAAYMTVHADATATALAGLGDLWHVGLVLMNQNCPDYLRTDEPNLDRDVDRLAERFGRRLIVTDRFAVAVDSPLRRRAVAAAERHGLRMQTHLNEQVAEKDLVERVLYPGQTYTGVYRDDGLLGRSPILAHCIHMRPEEWDAVVASGSSVAHCPTSNALLGSGVMSVDEVIDRRVPYAICTDVGASPTTSLLAEMAVYLLVHLVAGSKRARGSEALYRTTFAAAEVLGVADHVGTLAVGRPASFIEVQPFTAIGQTADQTIADALLGTSHWPEGVDRHLDGVARGTAETGSLQALERHFRTLADRLDGRVQRVTLDGRVRWARGLRLNQAGA